ncbi:poly-beta-1,6 N-acetyl-D-glucosamine export porin PgaA [Modicisalibacter ilicicola DSM 19980]|uniref:Poly-beta-1,6 N-acetyl-D-glucosamine export porin PgaA n=1 Tax=Modicisalibacter ilicicola DSM 19980 TaxID=1121942 RepID=A0A1M5EJE5_9GAMM|nr:poly-beta-1,6 N-acetyl-D-glucosamine export porin PgaA [Halomonas ilicicola]SHF79286.1 poly-beta-1,6 N-acetyl-D-glucosamine export porin PgaA [Halomonas ilicicola DSM 19980]
MTKGSWALLCLLGVLGTGAASAQEDDLDARREAWVIKARQGQMEEAIAGLARLYARTGDDAVLDDLIALRIRDGRYRQALETCQSCTLEEYSPVSLEALGRAAREVGDLERAQAFYQALTLEAPNEPDGWLGLALTNIDRGHHESAGWALSRFEERFGRTDDWFEARAYLASRTDDTIAELRNRQLLVERQPSNEQEVQALYRLAVALGADNAARRLMRERPEAFTDADRLWLRYYDAQGRIRLAEQLNEPRRARQALEALNEVITAEEAADGLMQRAEYDKVIALTLLRRFEEAELLAADLEQRYGPLPNYLTEARADALAGLHRPDEAARLYRKLIDADPEQGRDLEDPLYASLVYAYADAQRYDQAQAVLERWKAEEPATRWNFTGTQRIDNPNYARIQQLETMLLAWRSDEPQAEARLSTMLDQAPGNAWLWQNQGDLNRWRGMPRRAEKSYRRAAELMSPDDRYNAEYGVLLSRLARGQWRDTATAIEGKIAQDPPSAARDNLARELREQRAGGLIVEARRGDSQGQGVQSSRDWIYETRLEAPRNDKGSRFFAERIGQFGEYDDASLYAAYNAVGYEFNLYPATLSLAAGRGAQLNDAPLLWGELSYAFSDHWSTLVNVEINSAETPLRALRDDIHADLYGVEARYTRDESGSGGLGLTLLDLEDGNLRRGISGYWQEALYRHDRWHVEGRLFAGTSRNDDIEASYYNPRRDASASGEIDLGYLLPLGYRKAFIQTLTLGSGTYWQEDFGSEATWQIGYEHGWEFEPELTFKYGISRQKNVYDGVPEYGNFINAGFEWRFL